MAKSWLFLALGVLAACGEFVHPSHPVHGPLSSIRTNGPVQLAAIYRTVGDTLIPSVLVSTSQTEPVEVNFGTCSVRMRAYYDSAYTELAWIDEPEPDENGAVFVCFAIGLFGEARPGEPVVVDYRIPLADLRYAMPRADLNDELLEIPARRMVGSD